MELTGSAAQPMSQSKINICFVCLGNICRSPTLAAVFMTLAKQRGIADRFSVDSRGLNTEFLGQQADPRTREAARDQGIEIHHIAQLIGPKDFQHFDIIFAVTNECIERLQKLAPNENARNKILIATHFSKKYKDKEIPDPYYGSPKSFKHVLDMAFDACQGILDHYEN